MYVFILFKLFVLECKSLLENDCVFVCRICIAAKAEVGKAVYDIGTFIFFNALEGVWMMPQNKIGTFIDGIMC